MTGKPLHPSPEVAAAFEKLEKERAEYKAYEALRPPPKPKRPRKTQPQRLLEEIIPRDENERYPSDPEPLVDAPKFPTIAEQAEYWRKKEVAEEPTPVFTCPTCRKQFGKPEGVRMHVARVHAMTIRVKGQKHPFEVAEDGVTKTFRPLKEGETMINALTGRPIETLDTQRKKWSLARRRKFNAKRKAGWVPVPPPVQEEPVAMVRFCPCCGRNIERFLA